MPTRPVFAALVVVFSCHVYGRPRCLVRFDPFGVVKIIAMPRRVSDELPAPGSLDRTV